MKTRIKLLINCSWVLGWIAFVAPFFVLVGWQTGDQGMKRLLIGSDPMNPITAFLFILTAGTQLFYSTSSRRSARPLVVLVLITSVYQIIQYHFSLQFKIDQVLFGNLVDIHYGINPMAPTAAVGFVLLSLSILLGSSRRTAIAQQVIVLTVLIGAVFMITGYTLRVPEFHSAIHLFPALQTCTLFVLLAFSILLSQPEVGVINALVGDWEGSRIGRLLIPVTIATPFIITQFRLFVEHAAGASTELGSGLVLLSFVMILTVALFVTVLSLNARDQARKAFIAKINDLNAELKQTNNQQLASNQELSSSLEEIKSANEALSAVNEKLASAAETIRTQGQVIIEQKEEALKRSQQHLQIIFANTKEEILLIDTEGRLVIFNNAFEKFITKTTGCKPGVGMYVWEITVPSRREESIKLFRKALKGNTVTTETVVATDHGEVTHFLKYEPVIHDGKVSFVTLISVDITDRKIAERKLRKQFEELEKTNYELDHFVYSVSHDLRAPLSSILGLINVAEMEMSGELPFLGMIKGRVNHLDGFIKDILDYSRNARTASQFEKIDFSQLIEEAKANLKLVNGFDRLTIKLILQDAAPFYSDASRLEIIFNNLISNSIRFQDKKKPAPVLVLKVTTKEDRVEINATDNGIGIAGEHMGRIFDMFFRATDRSAGSGLGLYIVKETVAKLHGTIKAKSKAGEYTTFEIVIPNALMEIVHGDEIGEVVNVKKGEG